MSAKPRAHRRLASVLLALALGAPFVPAAAPAIAAGLSPQAPAPTAADAGIEPRVTGISPLTKEVYGYLPYWRLDSETAGRLRYDLVSTIAFFGLGIKADGSLDKNWVGYKEYVGDDAVAVTNAAHANGVRVVPTLQMFDSGTLPKMNAFLGSTTAQQRLITEALALMEARSADGLNLDFEPMRAETTPAYLAFVSRLRTAMKARFPTATLVNATSAGAGEELVTGLLPLVDKMFVMAYNYSWSGSTVAGPIAPLDNATRTVKIHIARFLTRAPADKIILGTPTYGYDWPVGNATVGAPVRPDRSAFGGVWSMSYGAARTFAATHTLKNSGYDAARGGAWFTYWDSEFKTYRQVWYENERSLAAKYDYAIAMGLAGVGTWTLGNDTGYDQLWNVIRAKFYEPVRGMDVGSWINHLANRSGTVSGDLNVLLNNTGNIPEHGRVYWEIRDRNGRLKAHSSFASNLYPGRHRRVVRITIGKASLLSAGTYRLYVKFVSTGKTWKAPTFSFRQRY